MKKPFYPNVIILIFVVMSTGNVGIAQIHEQKTTSPVFKQSIGVQFNPYIDQSLFTGSVRQYAFALRYSLSSQKGISFGPEFSGYYGHSLTAKWQNYNFGLFLSYTFLQQKKVSPFIEVSGYYQNNKMISTDSRFDFNGSGKIVVKRLSYYAAPGISFFILKKKLSIDFFVKFSTDKFLNSRNFIPSFRLVYHF
jgi:hypothetical protein